jgi:hypothetical protein
MPVVTVAQATQLRDSGQLNGRDVAVGGWFVEEFPPCAPVLGVYTSALEDCEIASFADSKETAEVCPNGACHLGHTDMAPWLLNDTLQGITDYGGADDVSPIPVVVIGHAADPRAWDCLPVNEDRCWRDFVADQIAWPVGNGFQQSFSAYDCTYARKLAPMMNLNSVAAALGTDEQMTSAAATTLNCVATIEPRWNRTGSQVVWVVHSVPTQSDAADPTRPVTVSLVDDATGTVIDRQSLAIAGDSKPARLWVTATRHNVDPNDHVDFGAFLRISDQGGATLEDDELGGVYGNRASLVAGPDVVLLDPGSYLLDAWLAHRSSDYPPSGTPGPPIGECTSEHTFFAGDDVLLNADYQGHHDCTWMQAPQPSFGMP